MTEPLYKKDATWHAEIVHFPSLAVGGKISKYDKIEDFCSYTRWFFWKLLVVIPIICLFIGGLLGFLVGGLMIFLTTFDWTYSDGFYGSWCTTMTAIAVFIPVGYAAVGVTSYYDRKRREKWNAKEQGTWVEPPQGFFSMMYSKWKNKFCPKMEY